MCYNISKLEKKQKKLEERYGVKDRPAEKVQAIYHESGFSHAEGAVLTTENPTEFSFYKWGLIPFWTKSLAEGIKFSNNTLNAVSETAFDKPSFRSSIPTRRCIIPVSGFFEWKDFKGKKYPHYIHLKSEDIFSLAGIYDHWKDKETGQVVSTYSILTCPANELMASIHNSKKRMPVILPKEIEKDWINPDLQRKEIESFFLPYPDDDMEAYTVSRLITSRKESTNVPAVFEKFDYPELL